MIDDWTQLGQFVQFSLEIDGRQVNFLMSPKDIEPDLEGADLLPVALAHREHIRNEALRAYRAVPHQGDGTAERPILVRYGSRRE